MGSHIQVVLCESMQILKLRASPRQVVVMLGKASGYSDINGGHGVVLGGVDTQEYTCTQCADSEVKYKAELMTLESLHLYL